MEPQRPTTTCLNLNTYQQKGWLLGGGYSRVPWSSTTFG
jgi:hypothetical protein